MSEQVKEAEVVTSVKEEAAAPAQAFLGGEIHIVSDPKTGQIGVNAPVNIVVALGLIEVAKSIIIANNERNVADAQKAALARPAIIPAGSGALQELDKQLKTRLS